MEKTPIIQEGGTIIMYVDLTNIYKKYKGLWVALNDEWNKVLGADKDIKKAQQQAIKRGYRNPIMFKVPKKNMAYFGTSVNG